MSDVQHAELFDDLSGEHQNQQEERQQKVLEALAYIDQTCLGFIPDSYLTILTEVKEKIDFLASECGVGEQWRKHGN